jgi:flavin-binding protein dodecin
MANHVYKLVDIVGTSTTGTDDAIRNAIETAAKTIRHVDWFEVTETRGHVENGKVAKRQGGPLPGDPESGLPARGLKRPMQLVVRSATGRMGAQAHRCRPRRSANVATHEQKARMVRIELQIELNYTIAEYGADFIFNIHAAQTPCQNVSAESLTLSQPVVPQMHTDPATGNRYMRLRAAEGELKLSYAASVELTHHRTEPRQLAEVPVQHLPPEVLGYLYPSRYCQSDRLGTLAISEFGNMRQGYGRVQAICDWVTRQVTFRSNTSNSNTSAVDTLIERVGVCRDFAHLMIALCRALSIPARFATGTDYGADPVLGPPDFHAYVEVYLGDRWYIFDPSGTAIPMGFVRLGTGRDAADVAVATMFGGVKPASPLITATAAEESGARGIVLPHHCSLALSTGGAQGAPVM